MAYNLTAEKQGEQDLRILHERLSEFKLIEFFPVEVADESLTLGISIPLKARDEPGFEDELQKAMSYLMSDGFQVTDLYTGDAIAAGDIPGLAREIMG